MPAPTKLPRNDRTNQDIIRRFEAGETTAAIGRTYDVSHEAIRKRLQSLGVNTARGHVSHRQVFPFRMLYAHRRNPVGKMLVTWSRMEQGVKVDEAEEARTRRFLTFLDGDNEWGEALTVTYDRDTEDGWQIRKRMPGETYVAA